MDTDLHRVVYSNHSLSDEHRQYFTYQILRGLLYLHSANIVHGNLKPHNILVNKEFDLKLCDFSYAQRRLSTCDEEGLSNDDHCKFVACHWYDSPEKVLLNASCASVVKPCADVWAAGCILCELFGRKPIFPGRDTVDLLRKNVAFLGTPSEEDLEWLPLNKCSARSFLPKLPRSEKRLWSEIYPDATVDGIDTLGKLLKFSPVKRITACSALTLPYFAALHMSDDEPVMTEPLDCSLVRTTSKSCLQRQAFVECWRLHPEIEQRDEAMLHNLGIDVLLAAERPAVLTLQYSRTGEDSNNLRLTFTSVSGSERASLCVDATEITIHKLCQKVNEQIEKQVRLVLPCGELLTSHHEQKLLADVLHCLSLRVEFCS